MPIVPARRIIMRFSHFLKVHQISSNLQNLLTLASDTCIWNMSPFREVKKIMQMPTVQALRIIIFSHLLKVHQITSNFQNLLISASETCIWNLSLFREVKIFNVKCRQRQLFEILWIFHISKFTEVALAWYGKLTWESSHAWVLKILCYLIVWGITLIFMVFIIFNIHHYNTLGYPVIIISKVIDISCNGRRKVLLNSYIIDKFAVT